MLVMMQFWCSDCWSLVLYSQGNDSYDAFSGALGTIPKPSQPATLPSFLSCSAFGDGFWLVPCLKFEFHFVFLSKFHIPLLSWILSFKKSFCVHNSLGKTFVKKEKSTKLQIMLKLSTSVRHNKIMLKWSTMSNTREAPAPSQLYSLSQTNQIVAREIARVWWGFFFLPQNFFRDRLPD